MENFHRLVPAAESRQSHNRPYRGMGVLTAVLPKSGRIALDVSWIVRPAIKGRREQQGQTVVRLDEFALHGRHRLDRTLAGGDAREDRPGLGDGIDPALLVERRAQRCAIVEPAP